MGKASAPPPPDPKETSAASTSTNVGTAIANAFMGNVNQNTPDGSLNYDQTGTYTWNDPYTGKSYNIPKFTATQTLSQGQQAIKGQNDAASLNLATLGNNLSGTLGQKLTGNFTVGNEATEARLFDLGSKRLDPMFARQGDALRTRLTNQGIREGSAAWNNAMGNFGQQQNDAYNQLLLGGRGQAVQEQLTEDNQRINQISALMNGGQVSQPNFVNANMPTIPTTDTAGIINSNYQQQVAAAQMQNQQTNSIMGGLFGLGSAGIFKFSDERLKTDIKKVAETTEGIGVYRYRYKGDDKLQVGVMAQEVEKKHPEAVMTTPSGFKAVNYGVPMGSIMRAA
jgi:hypothetical protein